MTISSAAELEALAAVGRVVAAALDAMEAAVAPGVSTAQLDEVAGGVFAAHGARSAPRLVYNFPGHTCISIADEVVHGIPSARTLRRGDLVKLDVTAERDGFMADAARSVVVGGEPGLAARLSAAAEAAFACGLAQARPGQTVARIGRAVAREASRHGFAVIKELSGHGIGRTIHEPPTVPNFDSHSQVRLEEGMVITIEPLLAAGNGAVYLDADGWTVKTGDRSLASHFEHTLVVRAGGAQVLTGSP